jgi:hypothetical protein
MSGKELKRVHVIRKGLKQARQQEVKPALANTLAVPARRGFRRVLRADGISRYSGLEPRRR